LSYWPRRLCLSKRNSVDTVRGLEESTVAIIAGGAVLEAVAGAINGRQDQTGSNNYYRRKLKWPTKNNKPRKAEL
jgi:hypothetical protein